MLLAIACTLVYAGSIAVGRWAASPGADAAMKRELNYVAPGSADLVLIYEDRATGCQYIGPDTTRGDHVRPRSDGTGHLCIPREGIYAPPGTPSPVVDKGPRR